MFFNKDVDLLKIYSCFYLTYDEPEKDQRWEVIKSIIPHAQRVDGIKGFDKAHKECARRSKTDRLTIIDGDNQFLSSAPSLKIPRKLVKEKFVLSFSSQNSINHLNYGNGGVKSWPKDVLLSSKTHEESTDEEGAVDFCFKVPYYQISQSPTETIIHLTPYQAFRAGYREGVKMSLLGGKAIRFDFVNRKTLKDLIPSSNYYRLKVWLEIGRDVENGLWAIYGARLGLLKLIENTETLKDIREYAWFDKLWQSIDPYIDIESELRLIATKLNPFMGEGIKELNAVESLFFKKSINNPRREGMLIPS